MSKKQENIQQVLKKIELMLLSMNYGSITLVVHDEHVVQIEKNEKIRLHK
ncbi:YezD family protein [Lysinibacillus halotolerans]|uniref:YezD family protein n=1 Tax=Ureibacillus galli TaxID=2762222 RepID=A0ABR8XGK2_9BACL|nr:YezD family protein [Ureibacillus galli]MBD8028353.1 YezD family protein [Ureibacillus galli]